MGEQHPFFPVQPAIIVPCPDWYLPQLTGIAIPLTPHEPLDTVASDQEINMCEEKPKMAGKDGIAPNFPTSLIEVATF
jgi:hypothetical protein